MADYPNTFLDYTGLTSYDTKIKNYIDTEDAKSIKFAKVSEDGNNLLLYKSKTAGALTPEAEADYTIPMGSSDLEDLIESLATAVGATETSGAYSVTFTGAGITSETDVVSAVDALADEIGTIGSLSTTDKTNLVSAINEVLGAISTAIQSLDVTEFALAEEDSSTHVVTIHGISETDGEIAVGSNSANDITLAAVAATGNAADVVYDNTTSGLTADDVQEAIDEVQGNIDDLATVATTGAAADVTTAVITDGAVENPTTLYAAGNVQGTLESIARNLNNLTTDAAVTVYSPTSSDYAAVYELYQGDDGSHSSSKKIGTINIPKDMVVSSGCVVDIVFKASDDTLHEGSESGPDVTEAIKGEITPTADDAGKYIKLVIANSSLTALYIKATALIDVYTSGSVVGTDEIIITVDNTTNQITATVGSVGIASTKVNHTIAAHYDKVPGTATYDSTKTYYTKSGNTYTEDTEVTSENFAEKVEAGLYTYTAATTESVQTAIDRLDEAAGSGVDEKIAAAIADLDATASQTAGTDGLALSVTEVDGKITNISGSIAAETYDAYGAASNAVAALDVVTAIPFATYTAGTSGAADTIVINGGVKETDGVIEAGGGDTITLSTITSTQIDALFS